MSIWLGGLVSWWSGLYPARAENVGLTLDDEIARNDAVRAALSKEGDDGTVPRPVEHWAYPREDGVADLQAATAIFTARGMAVRPADSRNGLIGSEETSVATTAFDEGTFGLLISFDRIGWDYDGWETTVVRPFSSS